MSIEFSSREVAAFIQARIPHVHRSGSEFRAPCPIHQGTRDSFAVNAKTGTWFCHSECDRGGDLLNLEMELSGVDFKTALDAVGNLMGRDLQKQGGNHPRPVRNSRIVAEYDYHDEQGELLYQIVRREPKEFFQRYPDGLSGWRWKKHPRQVLFHLPEVLESPIVFVAEGEKDAECLRAHGFAATTNSGGASAAWLESYTNVLQDREVILIPDRDVPGRARVVRIAKALFGHVAKLIILDLDHSGKDVSDWFEAGHSEIELLSLVEGTAVAQ
jgi:putative DNA primase/helicase